MDRATLPGGAMVFVTTSDDGDFSASPFAAACSTVHQVHGNHVVHVDNEIGELGDGDALISTSQDAVLAVRGADCPLIGLASDVGVIAAVHAGWKGLLAGVIGETVMAMRIFGASTITCVVGPLIGPECYEFSPDDLLAITEHFGDEVRSNTSSGSPALDLQACVAVDLPRADITVRTTLGSCTACSDHFYSWRARKDKARHGLIITRSEAFLQMVDSYGS